MGWIGYATLLADHGDDHHMWGDGGWMWLWGGLMMLFWVGVVVAVVWALVRGFGGRQRDSHAAEILAERYASGELDTEQYEERSKALRLTKR